MSKLVMASAGNTLAPALAVLRELGYTVSTVSGHSDLLQADNGRVHLTAGDPLQLLGLASIADHRGSSWQPTDAEIADLLALENRSGT